MKITAHLPPWMEKAIWDGDINTLYEKAGCRCCCAEHTSEDCPARLWEGCRGQGTLTQADIDSWVRHYGITKEKFLNYQTI